MTTERARRTAHQTVTGYDRTIPLIETSFTCGLCDQTAIEAAYPGATPAICATCLEKYPSRNAARVALWRKNNPADYEAQKAQQRARRAAARKG